MTDKQDLYSSTTACIVNWCRCMITSEVEKTNDKDESNIYRYPKSFNAELKRCPTLSSAMLTDAFSKLLLSLPSDYREAMGPEDYECIACIAIVSSSILTAGKNDLGKAAGISEKGDKPLISKSRFKKLVSSKNPEEFNLRLKRIVLQLKKSKLSLESLVKDIQFWFKEYYSTLPLSADKRVAVKWSISYYKQSI